MSEVPVASWPPQAKLESVLKCAAKQLPADTGEVLLQLLEPAAIATTLAVLSVWAGAHEAPVHDVQDTVAGAESETAVPDGEAAS
jgi:hypothetical protein